METEILSAATDSDGEARSIAVFCLGYVGAVSAACFAAQGHRVVGVDPQSARVELSNEGIPPVVENGLAELVRAVTQAGRLRATVDPGAAIAESSLSFVSVGTPGRAN